MLMLIQVEEVMDVFASEMGSDSLCGTCLNINSQIWCLANFNRKLCCRKLGQIIYAIRQLWYMVLVV